jgi:GntR family transcriptional regulator
MRLSRTIALPLYHQLRELLRDKIESGEWQAGHQLATVRQALQLLENDGLVERIHGKGTFVGRPKVAHDLGMMMSISANGSAPELRLQHLRKSVPGAMVAFKLGLEDGEQAWEFKRIIVVDGEPLMLVNSWLPVTLFPDLDSTSIKEVPLQRVMLRHYGIEHVNRRKEVEVTILDNDESAMLGANPGAPALVISYVSQKTDGSPFEFRRTIVRGDRCKYYIDINNAEFA